ncbi:MAG: glycoside hydrolase family 36 N-terminal domain-containing protein, partial [Lachnospiraceae bacterium]|nr:glycoside hydrolase family 36 N-terminal domain-containing protein [Lachnospiraceae bacterium]
MITEKEGIFYLNTKNTTYVFGVTKFKHLEQIYYGTKLTNEVEVGAVRYKQLAQTGTTVMYDASDENYSMDTLPLEWSGCGRGDYRCNPLEAKMPDDTFITDFTFQKYEIIKGNVPMQTLPSAYGTEHETQTLIVTLFDEVQNVTLKLYYSVYEACDVITRRVVMTNHAVKAVSIRKIQSMMIDLKYRNYDMVTFDGGWIREAHKHTKEVTYGMIVNSSTTGSSSNRHNPGFVLAEHTATQDHGWVYGFNLVYSGNHYSCVERSNRDLIRVSIGINP